MVSSRQHRRSRVYILMQEEYEEEKKRRRKSWRWLNPKFNDQPATSCRSRLVCVGHVTPSIPTWACGYKHPTIRSPLPTTNFSISHPSRLCIKTLFHNYITEKRHREHPRHTAMASNHAPSNLNLPPISSTLFFHVIISSSHHLIIASASSPVATVNHHLPSLSKASGDHLRQLLTSVSLQKTSEQLSLLSPSPPGSRTLLYRDLPFGRLSLERRLY